MGLVDNDQPLAFTVMVQNMRVQGFNIVCCLFVIVYLQKEELVLSCHIGEDYIERSVEQYNEGRLSKPIEAGMGQNTPTKQTRQSKQVAAKKPRIKRTQNEYNPTKWETRKIALDNEGSAYVRRLLVKDT